MYRIVDFPTMHYDFAVMRLLFFAVYDHLMLMLNLSCVFVPLFVCWVHTFRLGSFSVVMFVLFRNWMFNIRVCGMQSYFKFCYWFQSIKPENSS